ncbi:MAG: carboxymuconolactone decarboxylase family protein [bacterium]|nr:carboxymuconolactone decarboxylase family protein [bacterium]
MHPTQRLTSIETPPSLGVRFVYWLLKRKLGKVITPWKVVFARLPHAIPMQLGLYWAMERLPLDPDLQLLVQMQTAQSNDCAFCVDIGRAIALQRGRNLEKLDAVADFRTDPRFTERERAALAYVDEATRRRTVADETFATLRRHFDDREIAAITWINAVENYFNMINVPLGIESDGLCLLPRQAPTAVAG